MKTFITSLMVLLFATLTNAAELWVQNLTDQSINVAVSGTRHTGLYKKEGRKTIAPGETKKFSSWWSIQGPLRFAFTKKMQNRIFSIYTTYTQEEFKRFKKRTRDPKILDRFKKRKLLSTFPLTFFEHSKKVQIKRNVKDSPVHKRGELIIRQYWPQPSKHHWKSFIKQETPTTR